MPDVETEEFEKLKKYRERSRVSLTIKIMAKHYKITQTTKQNCSNYNTFIQQK